MKPKTSQILSALCICLFSLLSKMLISINLNNKFCFAAIKIHNKFSKLLLPVKLSWESSEKTVPKMMLLRSHVSSHFFSRSFSVPAVV